MTDIALRSELCSRARKGLSRRKAEIPSAHGSNGIRTVTLILESELFPIQGLCPICLDIIFGRRTGGDSTASNCREEIPIGSLDGVRSVSLLDEREDAPITLCTFIGMERV